MLILIVDVLDRLMGSWN